MEQRRSGPGEGRAGQEDLTDDGDMERRKMICRMSCYRNTGHPGAHGFSPFSRLDIFTILEFVDSLWMLKKCGLGSSQHVLSMEMLSMSNCVLYSLFCVPLGSAFVCVSASTAGVKGDVFPCDKQRNDATPSCQHAPVHF